MSNSLKFVQLQSPLLLRSGMEWALKAYNPLREQAPVVNLICWFINGLFSIKYSIQSGFIGQQDGFYLRISVK